MKRCSFCEWIPILPWPVWPLAWQRVLGQNTVVGSMTILLAMRGNIATRSMSGPPFALQLHRTTVWCRATADPGVADKRLMIYESEFASVLKVCQRDGSILSMTLRQAWESGNLQNTIKNSPERATGAHVGCIGHITTEEVRKLLATTEM